MKDFSKEIKAYALRNALEFGKAEAGRILPKLFNHGLDKKDIKKVMPEIARIVAEVNSFDSERRQKELHDLKGIVKEAEKKEEGLPELENAVVGKVVTRLAPEPSKYNHIGHALVFMIQYLYAKKYDGKCILRFEDTNPEKSTTEFYNAMKDDLTWLGIKWDAEIIASDDMEKYYELAEKLINNKNAYVCKCSQEDIKKLREKMKVCKCRSNSAAENLREWKNMLNRKYGEGERTLRLKGDMKSNNGVMRDPVIFRISHAKHFMQGDKYAVWPTYDFENPVEDALNGITHVIRSKEFELRAELHEYILKLLKLKMPIVREIGRYEITGAETQGRIIREMIEKKKVSGWDDPRLVTIKALRRRGFVPQMFEELAQTVGLSKSSGHIDPNVLAAVNRKIIDPTANRYSFVKNPVELKGLKMPEIEKIEVPVHPDKVEKREIKIGKKIFISDDDAKKFKGEDVRLLHLFNVKLGVGGKAKFLSEELLDIQKINWVSDGIDVKILMPDGKWVSGVAERAIENLGEGDIIQFERFGFCRFDKVDEKVAYEFWFSHK
jgi:glutamyl-tRNA synthetase